MKCLEARAMIERLTPPPTYDPFYQGAILPWSKYCLDVYSKAEQQRDARIMRKLKRRLSPTLWEHVLDCLQDSCSGGEFEIVRTPEGTLEAEALNPATGEGELHIDERERGGYSGDSYSGYGYIKVSRLDYLKFYYSM